MESASTTVADLVEAATAAAGPDDIAVEAGGGTLTYAGLDARANRLAHHLQSVGVGPDVTVGVCLPRSTDLAVALLAVLKAGGACVPLDPAYPAERLAFMAADAGVVATLTCARLADRVPPGAGRLIRVDADGAGWAARPETAPLRRCRPGDVAYVIYTSGSTGDPKGVLLNHRGLVNHHRAVVELYGLRPGDRVLQFCSLGFDASIEEMFPTWAAGATVVFRPDDVPLLGPDWLAWLRARSITVVNLPTAYWQAWARDLEGSGRTVPEDIRLVVVGGEKALGPTLRTWQRVGGSRPRWINAYGPTEATCMSTYYEARPGGDAPDEDGDPPIGRPLPNTTVRVVDEALRPVADGVAGELLIGGDGLARGYRNCPELTAERFVADGGGENGDGRMYRTGDLVRRLPGGDLDYVGRLDDQVKIQGFRVECGEVEAALARHPAVAAAAVVARDDPPGDRRLISYVVARTGHDVPAAEVRRFLARRLPAHLVPAAAVVLEALPLTPNGKVDRAALPAPGGTGTGPAPSVPPRSPVEDRLAAIWAAVLGMEASGIGPGHDFFDLGGHSLLATQVVARIREDFGTETPLRAVFEAPTLAGLAALVATEAETARPEGRASAPLRPRRSPPGVGLPLSLAQEQMWALEAAATPPGLYNFTALRRFEEPVDDGRLRSALASLVDRHEILRTGFSVEDGSPRQFVAPGAEVELTVVDLAVEPHADREAALRRRIAEHEARPFDPSRPPLFRVGLFRVEERADCLAVTFDHLIADGTSAAIFLAELATAYQAATGDEAPALPPLPLQFADFAVWQRAQVTEGVLRRQLDWWVEALRGMPVGPAVPVDHLPATPTRRVASEPVVVPAETRAGLEALARSTGGTVFTVAAAAAAACFGRRGGATDVMLSTTVSGRNQAELEGLLGTFSGMSRIRVDLSGDPPFTVVATRARDWALGMFEHSDIPFLRVRRAVLPDFPAGGPAVAAALPIELQYFHARADQEFLFRGQLHPLSLTLVDNGTDIAGELSFKLDFYAPATVRRLAADLERVFEAVAADPSVRLCELPVTPAGDR